MLLLFHSDLFLYNLFFQCSSLLVDISLRYVRTAVSFELAWRYFVITANFQVLSVRRRYGTARKNSNRIRVSGQVVEIGK